MTELITFAILKNGRIEAMLGKHLVGVIEPNVAEPYYQVFMPLNGAPDRRRPLMPGQPTRRLMLHRLAQWHRDAGPLYDALVDVLNEQAEQERETS